MVISAMLDRPGEDREGAINADVPGLEVVRSEERVLDHRSDGHEEEHAVATALDQVRELGRGIRGREAPPGRAAATASFVASHLKDSWT
jgi:hypothetical protein